MVKDSNISILMQLPGAGLVESCIHETSGDVVGVNKALGLMVMSKSNPGLEVSSALRAVEILQDDLHTNSTQLESRSLHSAQNSFTTQCMQESLENINEFLFAQANSDLVTWQDVTTTLTAVQYADGYISYIIMGEFCCLLFNDGKLNRLHHYALDSTASLGEYGAFEAHIQTQEMSPGDILLIAKSSEMDAIGLDYLRMTLSRFPDELEIALKQINTRATRSGLGSIPGIIIGKIEQQSPPRISWMDKLGFNG